MRSIYLQNLARLYSPGYGGTSMDDPTALAGAILAEGENTRAARLAQEAKDFQDWQRQFREQEAQRAAEHQAWYRGFTEEEAQRQQAYRQGLLDLRKSQDEWLKARYLRETYPYAPQAPYLRDLAGLSGFPLRDDLSSGAMPTGLTTPTVSRGLRMPATQFTRPGVSVRFVGRTAASPLSQRGLLAMQDFRNWSRGIDERRRMNSLGLRRRPY